MSELEDVYLQEIREIDEHVLPCFLLTTRYVYTDGDDVQILPSLGEFVLDGKSVHANRGGSYNVGETERVCHAVYLLALLSLHEFMIYRIVTVTHHSQSSVRATRLILDYRKDHPSWRALYSSISLRKSIADSMWTHWNPVPTKEPCTIAAPLDDSPKVTSETIVFSSTTVPQFDAEAIAGRCIVLDDRPTAIITDGLTAR